MSTIAKQLSLFPQVVDSAYLVAINNPRGTFYRLKIEENAGIYSIVKESGTAGNVLDRRIWNTGNLEQARKLFERRLKSKINPERKSPRKYIRI